MGDTSIHRQTPNKHYASLCFKETNTWYLASAVKIPLRTLVLKEDASNSRQIETINGFASAVVSCWSWKLCVASWNSSWNANMLTLNFKSYDYDHQSSSSDFLYMPFCLSLESQLNYSIMTHAAEDESHFGTDHILLVDVHSKLHKWQTVPHCIMVSCEILAAYNI